MVQGYFLLTTLFLGVLTVALGRPEGEKPKEDKKPDASAGAGNGTSYLDQLGEVYTKEWSKIHFGNLERGRKNLKSINKMSKTHNDVNIAAYRDGRKWAADTGTYVIAATQEYPWVNSILNSATAWVFTPMATAMDNAMDGAHQKWNAHIEESNQKLKRAKNYTKSASGKK